MRSGSDDAMEESAVSMFKSTDYSRSTRPAALAALVGILALIALTACQAPLETKRGAVGEFCNGSDTECRQGLQCDNGICNSPNNSPEVCQDICDKFEACDAAVSECYENCLATLSPWAKEVTETYRSCYVNDVSCAEIQDSQRPQNICYTRLELPEARKSRCDSLESTARRCLAGFEEEYGEQLEDFTSACRRSARTISDEDWSDTDKCVEWANDRQCSQLFQCINDNFQLQENFPTSRPSSGGSGGSGGSGSGSGSGTTGGGSGSTQ